MNKLRILLKANIINTLSLNKLRKKSTGKISPLAILLVLTVVLFAFGFAFMYLFLFGSMFADQGLAALILPLGLTAGSIVTLLTTISTANGYLFRSRDFELLMALPVKPRTVFASKLFYLLITNYVTLLFVYFPTVVVYAVYNRTDWVFWTLSLPVFLLFPLGLITVGSLISYLIGFLTSRFRYRNLLSIIFTIAVFVVVMFINFRSGMIEENPGKFTQDVLSFLDKIKIGNLVFKSLLGDWQNLLLFIGLSVLPFIGFVYLVGKSYVKASLQSRVAYTRKNFRMGTLKGSTQNRALLKREIRRYFSSSIYVINTIVGPILTTILLVVMAINSGPILEQFGQEGSVPEILPFILTAIFTAMLGITSTTSCSLSIEGRQFWILRSAPVREKQIFQAKILLNLLVSVPFILLDVIIANFIIRISLLDSLFMFILPSLLALYMSVIGLYMNILFPRFDYENETKVVKQSLSVLMAMICGFVGAALVLVPGFIVATNVNIVAGYLVELAIVALLVGIATYLLLNQGIKKYKKLIV